MDDKVEDFVAKEEQQLDAINQFFAEGLKAVKDVELLLKRHFEREGTDVPAIALSQMAKDRLLYGLLASSTVIPQEKSSLEGASSPTVAAESIEPKPAVDPDAEKQKFKEQLAREKSR